MAARKPIPADELADFLEKGFTPEQIAGIYKTTVASTEAQIRQLNDGAGADSQGQADDIASPSDDLTFDNILHPHARALLVAFGASGNLTAAARAAGVSRMSHYVWLESIDGYAAAFDQAREGYADLLESAAHTRAVVGVTEPVYQMGVKVGEVRRYSDTLMLALLKAKRPDEYKDRVETTHAGRVQYAHSMEGNLAALSVDNLKALREIARKLAGDEPEGGGPVP